MRLMVLHFCMQGIGIIQMTLQSLAFKNDITFFRGCVDGL
jgi:hypothetical protein